MELHSSRLYYVRVPEDLWPRSSGWRGEVVEVYKDVGDRVLAGEVVAEVEIEKAVLEIESPVSGRVAEVRARKGDLVGPGDVLLAVELDGA
ncbi:MAG: biotin/lipoyl-containing protein [Thermoproteota archaeon]